MHSKASISIDKKNQNTIDTEKFTSYQKSVILILAFLQFTIILDFMIMSPLGAIMMPDLGMTSSQFGFVVSAYAFSAGLSAIFSAGFADSFDRKKILLFFYVGFLIGTLLCGLSKSYHFLLFARIVTGLFGGVIGAVVIAISTDLFSFQQRGRVMGTIQTAFAASQVLGIPLSLFLANKWNWHFPFIMIVVLGAVAGVAIYFVLKPIKDHLNKPKLSGPFTHLIDTLKNKNYIPAFFTSALMSIGGFMLMPFMSAFLVNNAGISTHDLPMIYFVTGISAIFTGPLVGKAADKFGKFKVFLFGAIFTTITVNIYTHLEITPLWIVILVNVIMFASIFSRMIPSQALISAIPQPENRGAFMAVNSALQQVAGGIASVISGLIVVIQANGHVDHFEIVGYILTFTSAVSVYLMYKISQKYERPS